MTRQFFSYSQLSEAIKSIRLFVLEPGTDSEPLRGALRETTIDDADDSYEALSYAWGDLTTTEPLSVEGAEFDITRNLFEALHGLRQTHASRTLWIDAICINQKDHSEKADQVRRMHLIYRHAERVLAWVGPEVDDSSLALDELRKIGEDPNWNHIYWLPERRTNIRKRLTQPRLNKAIAALRRQDYWVRGWIVQEVFFAKDVIVVCGTTTLSLQTLECGIWSIITAITTDESSEFPDIYDALSRMCFLAPAKRDQCNESNSILEHLHSFRNCRFSDRRDHLYAFLNLPSFEDKAGFAISYDRHVHDVFEDFARSWIRQTRRMDVLSYICSKVSKDLSEHHIVMREHGMWMPDWSDSGGRSRPLADTPGRPAYSATKDSRVHVDPQGRFKHTLRAVGSRVDRIKTLSRVWDRDSDASNERELRSRDSIIWEWEAMLEQIGPDNVYTASPFDKSPFEVMTTSSELPLKGDDNDQTYKDEEILTNFQKFTRQFGSNVENTARVTSFKFPEEEDPRRLATTEAFWRTLIADKMPQQFSRWDVLSYHHPDKPGRANRTMWHLYRKWLEQKNSEQDMAKKNMLSDVLFDMLVLQSCAGRRFMITEKGYIGLAPPNAAEGMEIVLLEARNPRAAVAPVD